MWQFLVRIRSFRRNQRGAAATEFALILTLLVVPLLNAIDVGIYAYDYMELRDAAQVGAQAIWAHCAPTQRVPAALSCPDYTNDAINTAYGTPLGTSAQISFGGYFAGSTPLSAMTSPGEGYVCLVNGVLQSTSEQPPNFDEATASHTDNCAAHDYILVRATDNNYAPIFAQVSVASLLSMPTALVAMRLD